MIGKKYTWYIFLSFLVIYVSLALFLPSDPNVLEKYDLTQTKARLLSFTIVVPIIAIWFSAYYGYAKIRNYAITVKNSNEGEPFKYLSSGLLILVMSLPLTSCISSLLNYFSWRNETLLPTLSIARNYTHVLFALGAFYLIAKGAEGLAALVKKKSRLFDNQVWTLGAIIITSLFTWIIVGQSGETSRSSTYFMADWLIVLTLVIPYMYILYKGVVAAVSLYFYRRKVRGAIYKHALSYFSAGIATVIITWSSIQLLTTFGERLNRLDLTPILAVIYLLVMFYALGYILIAKGAKKLKTLEDV